MTVILFSLESRRGSVYTVVYTLLISMTSLKPMRGMHGAHKQEPEPR